MRTHTALVMVTGLSLGALAFPTFSACGGSVAPAPPDEIPDASSAVTAACNASAAAVCGLQTKCNPAAQVQDYGDAGTCLARQKTSCIVSLVTPRTGANPAHTTGCAAAETLESCHDDLDLVIASACTQVTGPLTTGTACLRAGQCASGFCAIPPQSVCGTCAPPPAEGASCLALTTCGQGLTCHDGVCIRFVTADGGACDQESKECGAGLQCVGSIAAGTATCMPTATTVGATCDPTGTLFGGCDTQLSLFCVSDEQLSTYGTCQSKAVASDGMPCGGVHGIETLCASGTCVKQGDAGATCVARAPDDAPCNTVTGPACLAPSRCLGTALDGGTSGTCQLPAAACP